MEAYYRRKKKKKKKNNRTSRCCERAQPRSKLVAHLKEEAFVRGYPAQGYENKCRYNNLTYR